MSNKIPWDNIETVFLDMDGTLLDLHFDWHFWMTHLPKAYATKNGIPIDEANEKIRKQILSIQGTLNWYCLDYWTKTFDLPVAALKHEIKHMIKAHPDVLSFLADLKAQNKKVVMVTNAHRDSLTLKLEMTDIGNYFDQFISAHDFGIPKEDGAIWEKIQQICPYNPDTTLLIDDNITALNTAKDYGIAHCWAATYVSENMDDINPKGFPSFKSFNEITPKR